MWGRKGKRIAELEALHTLNVGIAAEHRRAYAEEVEVNQILAARCTSLAADLKRAQNQGLGLWFCPACDGDHHLNHGPSGCPDPGCVCRIRDSDPTGATS